MLANATQDLYQFLAGAWLLVNISSVAPNGTNINPNNPTGANPVGLIQYTHTGYMSANIMATEPEWRPMNITWGPKPEDLDSDWAMVGRHTLSYAGPFYVEPGTETTGRLNHGPLTFAGIPSWVGTNQSRNYTIFEDGNLIQIHFFNATTGVVNSLWWRRGPQTYV